MPVAAGRGGPTDNEVTVSPTRTDTAPAAFDYGTHSARSVLQPEPPRPGRTAADTLLSGHFRHLSRPAGSGPADYFRPGRNI